jgi:probable HAF family extracellular repeat protein
MKKSSQSAGKPAMNWTQYVLYVLYSTAIMAFLSLSLFSCDSTQTVSLQDSLQGIPSVQGIEGAENSTINVRKGTDSYFLVDVSNISTNDHILPGMAKAWCIDWRTPISTGPHSSIKLHTSYGDKSLKPINYLLNIKGSLMAKDADLTYKEIQVAIWSLLHYPEFDLNKIRVDQIPSDMVRDGKFDFDRKKAEQIVQLVHSNVDDFEYNSASMYAVVAETPSDTQTIIIEVGETVWAYGQFSFRNQALRDQLGITGDGKGQWGWIYEFDSSLSSASTPLIAGGGNDDGTLPADQVGTIIGSLNIAKSGSTLRITYDADAEYLLGDLHLWVGCSLAEFPWVGETGNVAPGGFPYKYDEESKNTHTFSVDVAPLNCNGNIFIAAHAGDLFRIELLEPPIALKPHVIVEELEFAGANQNNLFYYDSYAQAINDNGDIVGSEFWVFRFEPEPIIFAENQGILWLSTGGYYSLPMNWDEGGSPPWPATDINIHNEVAGYRYFEGAVFLENPAPAGGGLLTGIGNLLGGDPDYSDALAINDNSQVVGYIQNSSGQIQAYIYQKDNGVTSLGTLPGDIESRATDINNLGQVVGWSKNSSDQKRYFLWSLESGMQDLGTNPIQSINDEGELSPYIAINNLGQAVNGDGNLYDPDFGLIDLGTISGYNSCSAVDINNKTEIVGWCLNSDSLPRAVKWTVTFVPI